MASNVLRTSFRPLAVASCVVASNSPWNPSRNRCSRFLSSVSLRLFGLCCAMPRERLLAEFQVSRLQARASRMLVVRRLLRRGFLAFLVGLLAHGRQIDALGNGEHLNELFAIELPGAG